MTRSRRCCCCNDLYFYNGDSITCLIRLQGVPATGVIVETDTTISSASRLGSPPFAIDLCNEIIFSVGGVPTGTHLRYCRSFDLKGKVIDNRVLTFQGDGSPQMSVIAICADWKNKRLFYSTDYASGTNGQIRVVNYDGTNDVQVTIEDGSEEVGPVISGQSPGPPTSIAYDPSSDRIYYATTNWKVQRLNTPSPGITTNDNWTKIKSVKPDGSGKTDLVVKHVVKVTGDANANERYGFAGAIDIDPIRNKLAWVENRQFYSSSTSQSWEIKVSNLSGGSVSSLLFSELLGTGLADANTRRFNDAQLNSLDGKLYFTAGYLLSPTKAKGSIRRINLDGSGEQALATYQQINDAGFGTFLSSQICNVEFGCGFEKKGPTHQAPA